jgi:hypothetical protein
MRLALAILRLAPLMLVRRQLAGVKPASSMLWLWPCRCASTSAGSGVRAAAAGLGGDAGAACVRLPAAPAVLLLLLLLLAPVGVTGLACSAAVVSAFPSAAAFGACTPLLLLLLHPDPAGVTCSPL